MLREYIRTHMVGATMHQFNMAVADGLMQELDVGSMRSTNVTHGRFFPEIMTLMAVVLSSMNLAFMLLPHNVSQSCRAGRASVLMAKSAATISASGVEWLTHDCLLEIP